MRREHEEAVQRVDVHWQMDQQMAPLNSQIKKLQMQKRGLQFAQFDLHHSAVLTKVVLRLETALPWVLCGKRAGESVRNGGRRGEPVDLIHRRHVRRQAVLQFRLLTNRRALSYSSKPLNLH